MAPLGSIRYNGRKYAQQTASKYRPTSKYRRGSPPIIPRVLLSGLCFCGTCSDGAVAFRDAGRFDHRGASARRGSRSNPHVVRSLPQVESPKQRLAPRYEGVSQLSSQPGARSRRYWLTASALSNVSQSNSSPARTRARDTCWRATIVMRRSAGSVADA